MVHDNQPVTMRVEGVSRQVGTATYPVFDSTSEAVQTLGEGKVLELVNAQVRTNEMNRVRGLARSGPSKQALRQQAIARIPADDWIAVAGNMEAIEARIEREVELLRAETLRTLGQAIAGNDTASEDEQAA